MSDHTELCTHGTSGHTDCGQCAERAGFTPARSGMYETAFHPKIVVGESNTHGRGVFARCRIEQGELIDVEPVLVVPQDEVHFLQDTVIGAHWYAWGEDEDDDSQAAIVLGPFSLVNHAWSPNVVYHWLPVTHAMAFEAYRPIEAGEELFINYNGVPDSMSPLWFDPV